MAYLIDIFLHLDVHLAAFVAQYGVLVYAMLFAIIFIETGLIIRLVIVLLIGAAIAGDAVNYSVGRFVGPKVFAADDYQGFLHKLLNRHHLDKAHAFFEKHGGMAIVSGRFVPIVRTFVPFVAGAASMTASKFVFFNVIGGVVWVVLCTGAGYLVGNVPIVKDNFSLVAIGIVVVSVLPMVIEIVKHRQQGSRGSS